MEGLVQYVQVLEFYSLVWNIFGIKIVFLVIQNVSM